MPSPSPSILLDLDGTLVDSQPGIDSSCRAALTGLGHDPNATLSPSANIGAPIEEVMRGLLEPYGDDRVAEAVEAYRADYGQSGAFMSRPYCGVAEALVTLKQSGVRLFLATSKRRQFALQILENCDFTRFFDHIHGSEPGGALDHKPDLIAHIIKMHGLVSHHCVMIGDRRFDIDGAHQNNMRALGVLWGYGDCEELEAAGSDALVAAPVDLPAAAMAMIKAIET